ncbi:MAG: MBL fold metallo-hydrolase [Gammaproteobacteria bacterium]|nr:MBL fold metallo-hydrolase [Gammaproteobacteria bacterium]
MRFASLGSGSKGNSTLIRAGDTTVLLDCGFSLLETEKRLARLECPPKKIDGILVTHEHGDHVAGVGKLSRKYDIPVWLTAGTYYACKDSNFTKSHLIDPHQAFSIDDIDIQPFPVPHDAREPCQFVFSRNNRKLGILTDVGDLTPCIIEHLSGLDALLLECNYDDHMLRTGSYPQMLKNRVSGKYGHLDNLQSRQILEKIDINKLQHLVAMHVSEKNNSHDQIMNILSIADGNKNIEISVACQKYGFDWKIIKNNY